MRSQVSITRLVRAIITLCLVAIVGCGNDSDSGVYPSKPEIPDVLICDCIAGEVLEVGGTVTYTATAYISGGGFYYNRYLDLDDARWSTSNSGIAVVDVVRPSVSVDYEFRSYRTSTAVIRAMSPGFVTVAVTAVYPNAPSLQSTGSLAVMPTVRTFELRATHDTVWAGETTTITPYAELVDGTDAHAYLDSPFLYVSAVPCSIACPSTVEWLGGSGYRITSNGIHSGVVAFHAKLGEHIVSKSVVVFAYPRS